MRALSFFRQGAPLYMPGAGPAVVMREAKPDEYAQVALLTIEAYQEFAELLGQSAWEQMRDSLGQVKARAQRSRLLVADEDGRVAGAVHYYPPGSSDPRFFPPEWASILTLMRFSCPARRSTGEKKYRKMP